jgi:hypothetical protein
MSALICGSFVFDTIMVFFTPYAEWIDHYCTHLNKVSQAEDIYEA